MKAVVWQDSVVVNEPIGEFAIEQGQVGEQEVFMEIHEAFPDGAVEAFVVGVHFGGSWTGPVVREFEVFTGFLEVAHEL